MPRRTLASIGAAAILVSTQLASTRRVQTEYIIQNPNHISNQKTLESTDHQASSFISRSQVESAEAVERTHGALKTESAASHELKTDEQSAKKSQTMWEWLSSGGPFTSLVLAISSHAFGDRNVETVSMQAANRYIYYCSVAIFCVVFMACSCCLTEWLKSRPWNKRNQYTHRGRVIYEWVQTSKNITFFTKLPPGMTQDSLEVKVWPKHAKFGRKGKVPFIKEGLYDSVDVDNCSWDISWKGELTVTMAKDIERLWPCVFTAHHPDMAVRERERSAKSHRSEKNASSNSK